MRLLAFIQIVSVFLSFNCNASENILDELSLLVPNAIDWIEEDRIYIKSDKVVSFGENFFVEGIAMPLQYSKNSSGYYLPRGARPRPIEERASYICIKCTWEHKYKPTICERVGCGCRDFIVRYR